eukprot:gene11790-2136_t
MPSFQKHGFNQSILEHSNQLHRLSDSSGIDYSQHNFDGAPPIAASSPGNPYRKSSIAKSFKVMSINCNRIKSVDKRAEFFAVVEEHQPHVILGQESKLDFILRCETKWVQLKLRGSNLLDIASFYRPPNSSLNIIQKFRESLASVVKRLENSYFIIGGDINLTCIDWANDCTTPGHDKNHCESFLDVINDFSLSQHVQGVTRPVLGKTLDLILTNNPGSVNQVSVHPGVSDHNLVISNFDLTSKSIKKPARKIY